MAALGHPPFESLVCLLVRIFVGGGGEQANRIQ